MNERWLVVTATTELELNLYRVSRKYRRPIRASSFDDQLARWKRMWDVTPAQYCRGFIGPRLPRDPEIPF